MRGFSLVSVALAGEDLGYNLLFDAWLDPVNTCVPINGTTPGWLAGKLLQGAPAGMQFEGAEFGAYLDGLGKYTAMNVMPSTGQLCVKSLMLGSKWYNQSVAGGVVAPGELFAETIPPRPACKVPMCDLFGAGNDNNYVNTVQLEQGSRVLAITDAVEMLDLDMESLEVMSSTHKFDDNLASEALHLSKMGSAHPLPFKGGVAGIMINIAMFGQKSTFILWHVAPDKPNTRQALWRIDLPFIPYLHAFGLTDAHAVVPMTSAYQNPKNRMARSYLKDALQSTYNGVYVVDLSTQEHKVFQCPAFNPLHVVNTFENATGVVSDIAQSPVFAPYEYGTAMTQTSMARNKTDRDAMRAKGLFEVTRYHFHLQGPLAGQCTQQRLSVQGRQTEFMRMDMRKNGLDYCVYYANEWFHDDDSWGSMAVLKHNLCTGERSYWYRANWYPSEPVFVADPKSTDEDAGVVMFTALDGPAAKSSLVVLDAKTWQEVSVTGLPQRMGFTAHAQYYPSQEKTGGSSAILV